MTIFIAFSIIFISLKQLLMTTSLATVLASIPRSDEQLAKDIGISSKTIKRIRTWTYKPSWTTKSKILDYLDNKCFDMLDFLHNDPNFIEPRMELSDLPKCSKFRLSNHPKH